MSEVAVPGTFVDETSFNFNTSFDTDDPLNTSGNFENEYTSSIEEITNFMNNTTCKEETNNDSTKQTTPPPVRLLTKSTDEGATLDDKANRKNKYYAPVYVVRDRVAGTTNANTAPPETKKREPKPSGREKRAPRENGHSKSKDDGYLRAKERPQPRQLARRDDEPVIEIKKKDEDTREPTDYQQRKMEEMRRVHEQEQQERERRLREKEKERQDRDKLQASRVPGERATLYDLMTVQFTVGSTFEPGEVVLVPRTRGGYSYGRVLQHFTVPHCYADSSVSHTSYHWRMVYPGPGGGNMFKDLPPAYIGKLVTFFNKDLAMPKDEDGERNIGDKPLGKDLNNAVFSPASKFNPHQMVLVPRSAGGFTYGRIVKECTFACRVDDSIKHEIPAWRVLVSGTGDDTSGTPKVRKDVLAGNIGKLYIPEQLQAAMQAASEAASLPTPSANAPTTGRRRVSPDARESVSSNTLPSLSSAPYLPSAVAPPLLNYAQALQGNASPASPTALSTPASASISAGGESFVFVDTDAPAGRVSPPVDPLARKTEETNDKPLRGVLELPDGIFAKAQKGNHKPRYQRSHDNNNNNNNNNNYNNNNNNTNNDNLAASANANADNKKPLLLVIDGPNVAMKHGNKTFSVKGISIVVQYYKSRGFDVVAFVPEYFATRKAPQHQLGSSTLKLGDFMNSVASDDMPMLNALVDQGLVVLTPPQDYDDSYSIEYARKHNCCIVTNDRYNDNIDKQPTEREKGQTRKFIRDHSISFTFVRDEFMPNPDFKFPNS